MWFNKWLTRHTKTWNQEQEDRVHEFCKLYIWYIVANWTGMPECMHRTRDDQQLVLYPCAAVSRETVEGLHATMLVVSSLAGWAENTSELFHQGARGGVGIWLGNTYIQSSTSEASGEFEG